MMRTPQRNCALLSPRHASRPHVSTSFGLDFLGDVFIACPAERRGDPCSAKAVLAGENAAINIAVAGGGAPRNEAPARLTLTGTPAAQVDKSLQAALRRAMRGGSKAASRPPVQFAMGLQAGS